MRKEGRGGANPECGDDKRAPCENDRGRSSQLEAVVRVFLCTAVRAWPVSLLFKLIKKNAKLNQFSIFLKAM